MYKGIQKKPAKDEREMWVLLGLVELYLEMGKPIGSDTLRENGYQSLSAATIRNYFVKLEKTGYLKQQHSSGGRIPTELAYKHYIQAHLPNVGLKDKENAALRTKLLRETREVAFYLQRAAETISDLTGCAVFLSSPRFDQDYLLDIKLMAIDAQRCLCVLITDFGMVHTQMLYAENGLSKANLDKIAEYLQWRINGMERPKMGEEEEKLASQFYRELMLRHIVTYANFSAEDVYKTGFSKLLAYPDFNNATSLASGLSLFENEEDLRLLLKQTCQSGELTCLMGEDLSELSTELPGCSLVMIPYRINQSIAGAIGLLGPLRLPYRRLFGTMRAASDAISESLTRSLYKFKITFRQPKPAQIELGTQFLEDKHG